MPKVTFFLQEREEAALRELAAKEYREPHAQAAWIVKNELVRLGYIKHDQNNDSTRDGKNECQ